MTNKRKRLIKAVAERTGVSHAGAANILNQTGLTVRSHVLGPKDVGPLFVTDAWPPDPGSDVGGFVRRPVGPSYAKDPGDTAFAVNEDGESMLGIQAPRNIIVPMVTYEAARDPDYLQSVILERMVSLIDVVGRHGPQQLVRQDEVQDYLREEFKDKAGTVHLVDFGCGVLYGVLNHAGIRVFSTSESTYANGSWKSREVVGLVTFSSRIRAMAVSP